MIVPFEQAYKMFFRVQSERTAGCLMIYWPRFTQAFRLEAEIGTELSTENPEFFQASNLKKMESEYLLKTLCLYCFSISSSVSVSILALSLIQNLPQISTGITLAYAALGDRTHSVKLIAHINFFLNYN